MAHASSYETRHCGGDALAMHRHRGAYAALVLDGEHLETGCEGRVRCPPGTLLIHPPFHAHGNRFSRHGARVLNLPLPSAPGTAARAYAVDLRAAADCLRARDAGALPALLSGAHPLVPEDAGDWSHALLAALRADPSAGIGAASRRLGVSPEHASRTLARRYGLPPQALRLELRFRAALALLDTDLGLAEIAQRAGFADQSHLGRTVRRFCGASPARVRAWIKCVQDGGAAPALECGHPPRNATACTPASPSPA